MSEFNDLYEQYKHAVEKIAMFFSKKYFGRDYAYSPGDWIAEDIGGIIEINDHYFTPENMIDFMKYRYTRSMMFEYYDYGIGSTTNEYPINIKNWIKIKKIREEKNKKNQE